MIILTVSILILSIILMIVGAFTGSGVLSKMVSVNCITSYIIALIAVLALTNKDNVSFLDLAMVYGAVGFVSSVAFLKYFSYRK